MFANLTTFFVHWAVTALSLWLASRVFKGIRFADTSSLTSRRCCWGSSMRCCGPC